MFLVFGSSLLFGSQERTCGPHLYHSLTLPSVQNWSSFCKTHDIPIAVLVQVAWVLVIHAYTAPDDSITLSVYQGGHAVEHKLLRITTIPSLISSLRDPMIDSTPAVDEVAYGGGNSLTSLVTTNDDLAKDSLPLDASVIINIKHQDESMVVSLSHSSSKLHTEPAALIAGTLHKAILQIMRQPSAALDEISMCSHADLNQMLQWNQLPPAGFAQNVDELISHQCELHPDSTAICSWDGSLSYGDLDVLSTQLADELRRAGAGSGTFIPLFMETSMWATVALLAVMKAGSAFLLLDVSLPLHRLREMCSRVSATLIVSSEQLSGTAASLATAVLSLKGSRELPLATMIPESLCKDKKYERHETMTSENALYAAFTSGSTGKPKCVVISHRAFATAAKAQISTYRLCESARVLQFSSFSFDASIAEILYTLLAGGCLCIPTTAATRNNLDLAIRQFQVNWTFLTPTVARLLSSTEVSTLRTLALVGEAVTKDDIVQWASGDIHLMIGYGPAECTPCSAIYPVVRGPGDANMIGRGLGASIWITDPQNPSRLMPIGAPGELIIEGPTVASGYLGDPERTAASFIDPPEWLRIIRGTASVGKLYRTGDLGYYGTQGWITYLGRKDAQVKIHGQRLELEEVQYQIKQGILSGLVKDVVVEAITPADASARPVLAAFILRSGCPSGHVSDPDIDIFEEASVETRQCVLGALDHARTVLPRYMLPSFWVPLSVLPVTASGKTDRNQLRWRASRLSRKQLASLGIGRLEEVSQMPSSAHQYALLGWVRDVLAIPEEDELSMDSNLFLTGMDSITAIKLVAKARQEGVSLELREVLENPKLLDLAEKIEGRSKTTGSPEGDEVVPFSLLPHAIPLQEVVHEARIQCGVTTEDIEDIYPCTPAQEGMMAETATNPEMYTNTAVFALPPGLDLRQFQLAWDATAAANPILRTRIIVTQGGHALQVVLRRPGLWRQPHEPRETELSNRGPFGPGKPLICLALNENRLTVTLHHAMYDGWSLPLILDQVDRAYHGDFLHHRPFSPFIRALVGQDSEAMESFWRSHLHGISAPPFPDHCAWPKSLEPSSEPGVISRTLDMYEMPSPGTFTIATAIKLAWGLTIARYTGSSEVLMGLVSTGRSVSLPEIDLVTGPSMVLMPERLTLDFSRRADEVCNELQQQMAVRTAAEHLGLQRLRTLNDDCAAAASFHNLLVVQQQEARLPSVFGVLSGGGFRVHAQRYEWTLECEVADMSIQVNAHFNRSRVTYEDATRILNHFTATLTRIRAAPRSTLGEVSGISSDELAWVQHWNKDLPSPVGQCAHDIISHVADGQPEAQAIASWDGTLTYDELEWASSKLAAMLVKEHSVQPETFVALCFPRSKWAVIAMLGVIKAGGAFVLLEPSYPRQRLESICRQVGARVLLTAAECVSLNLDDLLPSIKVIPMGDRELEENCNYLGDPPISLTSAVNPSNALYAVFTSGSTGSPKGTVIEHGSFATNVKHGLPSVAFGPTDRVLHFASYAFDASIAEVLFTLSTGGCVCVPHERERMDDLAGCINSLAVTTLLLTPSVARTLDPARLPTVKRAILMGEPMNQDDLLTWENKAQLVNAYGPSECTMASVEQLCVTNGCEPTNIGTSRSAGLWVVDPEDPEVLVPLGAPGELLIEGPIVGRGYLDAPHQTSKSFIPAPAWLRALRCQHHGHRPGQLTRVYRTGDIVKYSSAGAGELLYLHRKDQQVKLHGQRLELAEVEFCLRRASPDVRDAIVDLARPANSTPLLVAFVRPHDGPKCTTGDMFGEVNDSFHDLVRTIRAALLKELPSYMVPSRYVHLQRVPLTVTGKLDRRKLCRAAETYEALHMCDLTPDCTLPSSASALRAPASEAEVILQQCVAQVLGRPQQDIPLDADFSQLGGDSLTAMRLLVLLRKRGFKAVGGPDLYSGRTLCQIAQRMVD